MDDMSFRIIDLTHLMQMIPLSRSQLWRMEKAGEFPRRIRIGRRRVGWRLSDVQRWIDARATDQANG